MSTKRHVTVFVRSFPVLSETFVINQIKGLVREGLDVAVLSVNPTSDDGQAEKEIFGTESKGHVNSILPHTSSWKTYVYVFFSFFYCLSSSNRWRLLKLFLELFRKGSRFLARDLLAIVWFCKNKKIATTNCIAHFGVNGVVFDHLRQAGLVECDNLFTIFHGYEISKYEQINTWKNFYAKLTGTLLPISEKWKARLVKFGAEEENIKVLHMGVNVDKFTYYDKPLSSPLNMLSVARATEKKGLTYAIDATLSSEKECRLVIVGDGHLMPELKAQVDKHPNKSRIFLMGSQPPSEVSLQLKKADVFILPSVTDNSGDMEGIPVSLMEAMASGVVVLSTYHSGIPELIQDNISGFLVPERDVNALIEKIELIIEHDNIATIRERARKRVEEEFNAQTLNLQLVKLLNGENVN